MPNYYEILEIQPTATTAEIESACDARYHEWRRLVTHHDPDVVNQANQAMRTLETIRATLTDKEKRAVYDAAIGIGNNTGGLADPSVLMRGTGSLAVPVASRRKLSSDQQIVGSDAWVCPKCQTHNEPGVQYCEKCGAQIGSDCPNCGQRIQAKALHCVHCGVDIAAYLKQQEMEEQAQARHARVLERQKAEEAARAETEKKARSRRRRIGFGIGCLVLIMLPVAILGGLFSLDKVTNILSKYAGATATAEASVPKWQGDTLQVRTQLWNVYNNEFGLQYEIINMGAANCTISFLTSDIVVRDNLGNTYPEKYETDAINGVVEANGSKVFRRVYEGWVDPSATSLEIGIPKICDEYEISVSIPVESSPGQTATDFSLGNVRYDDFSIRANIQNLGQAGSFVRFETSDISVTDDMGNTYVMGEYDQGKQYMVWLNPVDDYGAYESYLWNFAPGIAPDASHLSVELDDLMGEDYNEILELGNSGQNIRYEAVWSEGWSETFHIDLKVFNLGSEDLVVRFDESSVLVSDAEGREYHPADSSESRVGDYVSSGDNGHYRLEFDGLPSGKNLTLLIPVFCAEEDVRIPVQFEE